MQGKKTSSKNTARPHLAFTRVDTVPARMNSNNDLQPKTTGTPPGSAFESEESAMPQAQASVATEPSIIISASQDIDAINSISDIDPVTGLYPVYPPFEGIAPEAVKFNWKSFAKGLPSAGWGALVGTYFGGLQMKRSDVSSLKAALFGVGYVVNYLGAVLLFPRVVKLLKDMGVRRKDFPYLIFVFSGSALAILSTIPIYALAQDASAELFTTWPLDKISDGNFKSSLKIIGDAGYIVNNDVSRTWGAVYLQLLGWELTLMRRAQPDRYFLRELAGYLNTYKNAHPSGFPVLDDTFCERVFHNIKIKRENETNDEQKSCLPILEKIAAALSVTMILGSYALPPLLLALTQKGGSEISKTYPSDSWALGWGSESATHMFYARALYLLFGLLLGVVMMLHKEFRNLPMVIAIPLLTFITAAMIGIAFLSGEGWGVEARELAQLLQRMKNNSTNPYGSVAAETYFPWAGKLYAIVAPHYGSYWAALAGGVNLVFMLTSLKECLGNKAYYKISFLQAFAEKFFCAYGLEDKLPIEEKARKKNIEDAKRGVHAIKDFDRARQLRDEAFETSVPASGGFISAMGNCFYGGVSKCWGTMFGRRGGDSRDHSVNAALLEEGRAGLLEKGRSAPCYGK